MHPRSRLKRQVRQRFDRILAVLTGDPAKLSPSGWHRLRVELKKTRALLELIASCVPGTRRKSLFNPLRPLFRRAGAVRDLQVATAFFARASLRPAGPEVLQRMADALTVAQQHFRAGITSEQLAAVRALRRLASGVVSSIRKRDIERYFERMKRKIGAQLRRKAINEEGMHRLRRELKHYYYNSRALGRHSRALWRRLDDFQELLGQWHDCVMAEEVLEKWADGRRQDARLRVIRAGIRKRRSALIRKLQKTRKDVKLG